MMKKILFICAPLFIIIFLIIFSQSVGVGRYQIYMNPNIRADQYLLDTKTGRTWQLTEEIKEKYMFWHEIPRDELNFQEENSK